MTTIGGRRGRGTAFGAYSGLPLQNYFVEESKEKEYRGKKRRNKVIDASYVHTGSRGIRRVARKEESEKREEVIIELDFCNLRLSRVSVPKKVKGQFKEEGTDTSQQRVPEEIVIFVEKELEKKGGAFTRNT